MHRDYDLSDPADVERWQHANELRGLNRWQGRAVLALVAAVIGFAVRALV